MGSAKEEKSKVRTGEDEKNHFRSERIVVMNGQYYFMTRENTQEGPFDSRLDAERELNLYIRHMNDPNWVTPDKRS
jgi:hypothetical protein